MALPKPIPGLVLRYSYLWRREALEGFEEGRKDRPCAIVAALRKDEDGDMHVLVLPVTHSHPLEPEQAIELPAKVKKHLGLDNTPSWIILSEWNEFVWPGPDLRRIPGGNNASVAYGVLPPRFFVSIRDRFIEMFRQRKIQRIFRRE